MTQFDGKANDQTIGRVRLVGAGPGDPKLLTLRALECLHEADVVVYDRLVSDGVLAQVPAGIPKIYAGKAPGQHHMKQRDINQRIVGLARTGHDVVRLKGGDPFVFGRGGEEAQYLRQHGVPFEIVPGVTAASACAAYSGIPLTHRSLAQGVQLVAGHCRSDEPLDLDWRTLCDRSFTVVFYMGLATVAQIRDGLLQAGRSPSTPAAIVENGTLASQHVWFTSLDALAQTVERENISSPALIVIGDVVRLADQLTWRDLQGGAEYLGEDHSQPVPLSATA